MEKLIDYKVRHESHLEYSKIVSLEMIFLNGDGLVNNTTIFTSSINSVGIGRYLDDDIRYNTLSVDQKGSDSMYFRSNDEQSMKNMEEIYTLLTQI